ncbi:MAG: glycosyltransferase family 4 protein [Bacteroidota bacterium]
MKIVLITAYAIHPLKGSEDGTAWNLVLQIARQRRVILITRENNVAPIKEYLAQNEIPQVNNLHIIGYDLPYYLRFWKRGGFGALPYFYLWQRGLPGFIKKQRFAFDLVHNLNFHNDWTPSFLHRLAKPMVWGPIGHHPKVPKAFIKSIWGRKAYYKDRFLWLVKLLFWRFSPALRRCAERSDAILPINSSVAQQIQLEEAKTHIFPAVGAYSNQLPRTNDPERFEVLSVGRFVPLKGFDLTLKSFARFWGSLNAEQQKNTRLSLVGKGPLESQLKQLTQSLGIEEAVDFINWMPQAELMQRYQSSDVLLFPSHEGAGMVVPEAMAYGLPVICLDNCGPGEFVDESCGLKASYGTYEQSLKELSQHLSELHQRQSLRASLSAGARWRVKRHFDWEAKGAQLDQIYQKLEAKPQATGTIVAAHLLNNFTGSPQVLAHALNALEEAGREVHLYTSKGPGFLDEVTTSQRFHHAYRWSANKYIRLIRFFTSQIMLFFRLLQYWRKPVTIYANTILAFGAAVAGKLMGKRVVYHVHETAFQPAIFSKFLVGVMKATADKIIFVSEFLKDFHQIEDLDEQVIYNALSTDFVAQANAHSAPQKKDEFEVMMACSLKKEKGIFEYLALAEKMPALKFKLIISQTEAEIKRFLGDRIVPQNVNLLGLQSNMHPHYASADLLLNLSHPDGWIETFGMTIIEGMTYGLPAIVPPIGAPVELVESGKEGYQMNPYQVSEIADRIWLLYSDEAKRKKMGKAAKSKAAQFRMEVFAQEIVASI